jgi:hypothetical protein
MFTLIDIVNRGFNQVSYYKETNSPNHRNTKDILIPLIDQVILASATVKVLQPLPGQYEKFLRSSPFLHWIDCDYTNEQSVSAMSAFIQSKTTQIEVAIVVWPLDGARDEGGFSSFANAGTKEGMDAQYWLWRMVSCACVQNFCLFDFVFLNSVATQSFPYIAPMCICSAIFPLLSNCPNTPRLGLHGSQLASISQNHSAGLANVRAAFAAGVCVCVCVCVWCVCVCVCVCVFMLCFINNPSQCMLLLGQWLQN